MTKERKRKFQWHIYLGEHSYESVTSRLRSSTRSAHFFFLLNWNEFGVILNGFFQSIYKCSIIIKVTNNVTILSAKWCACSIFALATRWGNRFLNITFGKINTVNFSEALNYSQNASTLHHPQKTEQNKTKKKEPIVVAENSRGATYICATMSLHKFTWLCRDTYFINSLLNSSLNHFWHKQPQSDGVLN